MILHTLGGNEAITRAGLISKASRIPVAARAGRVEFSAKEFNELLDSKLYVVAYNTVYQPVKRGDSMGFSVAYKHKGPLPLTKRGRYVSLSYKEVNSLVRSEWNQSDKNLEDRERLYVRNGKLPPEFESGNRVPVKYRKQFEIFKRNDWI